MPHSRREEGTNGTSPWVPFPPLAAVQEIVPATKVLNEYWMLYIQKKMEELAILSNMSMAFWQIFMPPNRQDD